MVLVAVEGGGSGCACPESTLLRALVTDLVLYKEDTLILDMEAGVEHLGRGTARGVDVLLAVVEPSAKSVETARKVEKLAGDIGLKNVKFVGNKATDFEDEKFLAGSFDPKQLLGILPFSKTIREASRSGRPVLDALDASMLARFEDLLDKLETVKG